MPKKTRKDYPKNWEEIAMSVKKRDEYRCQSCKIQFIAVPNGGKITFVPVDTEKLRRLTVHHKDRDVGNSDREQSSVAVLRLPLPSRMAANQKRNRNKKNSSASSKWPASFLVMYTTLYNWYTIWENNVMIPILSFIFGMLCGIFVIAIMIGGGQ